MYQNWKKFKEKLVYESATDLINHPPGRWRHLEAMYSTTNNGVADFDSSADGQSRPRARGRALLIPDPTINELG